MMTFSHIPSDSSSTIILPYLGYRQDDQGLESWQGLGIFLLTNTSRLALGHTQPSIQWVPGVLSLEIKWPGCKDDHSLHLLLRLRMRGTIPPIPNMPSWHGAHLKHRGNSIFYIVHISS
jgi:hypothetical protein